MINCDGWLVGAVREPPLRSAPAAEKPRTLPLLLAQKGDAASAARRRGFIHRFLNYDRHDFSMMNCDGGFVGSRGGSRTAPTEQKGGEEGITAHHPTSPQSQFKTHPPLFAPAKGGRGERSETQGVHTPARAV